MILLSAPRARSLGLLAIIVGSLSQPGCDRNALEEPAFRLDRVAVRRYELDLGETFTDQQLADLNLALAKLFGTPDHPLVPAEETVQEVLDLDLLRQAAGPVGGGGLMKTEPTALAAGDQGVLVQPIRPEASASGSQGDTFPSARGGAADGGAGQGGGGLFRRHCAHCHGITGGGDGPAAEWMNPYPRDFRPGKFMYKSTPLGQPPTDDDLRRVIVHGAPGTAMPAFDQLPDDQIDALVAYVKYLSLRGQTELLLIDTSSDLDAREGERLDTSDEFLNEEIVAAVAEMWAAAGASAVDVPPRPEMDFSQSAELGREIYFSEVGGCVKCHGPTGLGDGPDKYYDDWSDQLDPSQPKRVAEFVAVGALPPRQIVPHNLRLNVYRGGRRPIDLYWRIHNGIDGTPMPVASMKAPGATESAAGLTTDQIWHLVDYVRSLPYAAINRIGTVAGGRDTEGTQLPEPPVAARVTVRQFDWQIQYAGPDDILDTVDDVYAVNRLRLPVDEDRTVIFASDDVRHDIGLPEWQLRETLVPGRPRRVRIAGRPAGEYAMIRHTAIGGGHPPVAAQVVVERRER